MNLDYISLQQTLYGVPSQNKLAFLNSRKNESMQRLGQYQSMHAQQADQLYNLFNSNEAIERTKLLLTQSTNMMNDDFIYDIGRDDIYKVNNIMKQYIMANPVIYNKVNKQLIDGYSTSYVNQNKYEDPYLRKDYMNVMDGVIMDSNDTIKHYHTDNDTRLSNTEQGSVIASWRTMLNLFMEDCDPTDLDSL